MTRRTIQTILAVACGVALSSATASLLAPSRLVSASATLPKQVIGSAGVLEFRERDGKAVLVKTPKLLTFNDKQGKPAGIALHTGRVPIFAAGNVRTGGDIAMLRYAQSSKHPSLQLLVNHDDADREFAYAEKDSGSLNAAREHGWVVVSMKDDWNVIFSFRK